MIPLLITHHELFPGVVEAPIIVQAANFRFLAADDFLLLRVIGEDIRVAGKELLARLNASIEPSVSATESNADSDCFICAPVSQASDRYADAALSACGADGA